jgi:selenide,water dikinase
MIDEFIAVDDYLQSVNTPSVFAAGDVAMMVNHPRPRAGVFAVRQGPPLANNLRHFVLGEPLEPHVPQSEFLGIISTGSPDLCVASKGVMAMEGAWLWDLKDWIDRKWMASYTTALPDMAGDMEAEATAVAVASGAGAMALLSEAAMRCGGCGSKVGATVLSRVLSQLRLPPRREEVLVGLDAPDDCAVVRSPGEGLAIVHTVDFFRSFITDPYMFGRVAANHALSDCHAMGAEAVSALALAVVPFAAEDKMEHMLLQVVSRSFAVAAAVSLHCDCVTQPYSRLLCVASADDERRVRGADGVRLLVGGWPHDRGH